MKLFDTRDIRVTDEDEPALEPGTVRVDISYTGVCGSDVREYKIGPVPIRAEDADHRIPESEWEEYLPKPMGHEIAGAVSKLGEGVEDVSIRHAALAEPLSVSVHAVRRSRMRVGDTVAVFGAEFIGLGIVDAAQSAGADRILTLSPGKPLFPEVM